MDHIANQFPADSPSANWIQVQDTCTVHILRVLFSTRFFKNASGTFLGWAVVIGHLEHQSSAEFSCRSTRLIVKLCHEKDDMEQVLISL